MQTAIEKKQQQALESISSFFDRKDVQARFEKTLGENSSAFVSSLVSLVNSSTSLQECPAISILSAAMTAATLKLPINASLGFAYIIPFKHKATFQIGYKGYIQLAMRTGQYSTITVNEVYDGEIRSYNRFTNRMEFGEPKKDAEIVGYIGYFKLINGFEKYLYMTVDEIDRHGKLYSQSYKSGKSDSLWIQNFDAMARKTVIKRLISKYGIMSVDFQQTIDKDGQVDDGLGAAQRAGLHVVTDMQANQEEIGFDEPEELPEAEHASDVNIKPVEQPQEAELPKRSF
ncbi:recombinase RecT [Pectinatus haikarae]|uniref:Recombination protein RecT n=1 Tax=Pectinatus haikarae TaxID=349096 RepID=A0ABT9Y8E4_9FIRM|nr:recombinase RecT [Pectinatus haikarae]MDQ0204093.1 recombination protein RecT [Pectinatus haikarae]